MIARLVIPLVYSLLLGTVWSVYTNKTFYRSLAPAFMVHVLLVLFSGLIFKQLTIGIYGGIILAVIFGLGYIIKDRKSITIANICARGKDLWNGGVFVFLTFYLFCFFTNHGKVFIGYDEFSHWGMFLKESLRLDSLFCMSPLTFSHKDYVPAITLFETIWCRLNGRFAEADAYRAIQILMFSLLMPMFEHVSDYSRKRLKEHGGRVAALKARLFELSAVLLVLLIPLLFNNSNYFYFFHSIYCDIAVGVVFFWCVFEAYREQVSLTYHLLSIKIGITFLVLAKQTAMALLPLVIVMLFVKVFFFSKERLKARHYLLLASSIAVPVGVWFCFNKFASTYVQSTADRQSYGGMSIATLRDVFLNPQNSGISYLNKVKSAYIDALIHKDILIHGSYVVVMLFAVVAFFVLSYFTIDSLNKKRMVFAGLWTLAAGLFYCALMYFLYCTAFVEREAVGLASYERYMNSFVISIVFFLIAIYYDSNIWIDYRKSYFYLLIILAIDLSFFHIDAFDQVLPGSIAHDSEKVEVFTNSADIITKSTSSDSSIYIIRRGDTGAFNWHERYYCSPRTIGGGSIGPKVDDGDVWSSNVSVKDFVNSVSNYDYIYFCGLDEAFKNKYSVAFEDPSKLVDGKIYKVVDVDSKIRIE